VERERKGFVGQGGRVRVQEKNGGAEKEELEEEVVVFLFVPRKTKVEEFS
jgi:hypothetical protein